MLKVALVSVLLALGSHLQAASYSYADLLRAMIDLRQLAYLPQPGEKCYQFSSYDRKSKTPQDPAGWNANRDHGNYLRREGDEYVMAEDKGPGAIVRIWSANPQGTLKIYLDGAREPQFVAPAKPITVYSWQNPERKPVPGGTQPAWVFPPPISRGKKSDVFCGRRSAGYNLYLPIPYQKSMKVTVEKPDRPESLYYHVTVRRFPAGTKVPTCSLELIKQHTKLLKRIRAVLKHPEKQVSFDPQSAEEIRLGPGQSWDTGFNGPAAITQLVAQIEAKDLRRALREVILTITFDGARTPQVWAPLGDFFGTMPGKNLYRSLPLGVTQKFWYCRWYMPFENWAELRLINEGSQTVTIRGTAALEDIAWSDRLGYFHAKWRCTRKNTTFDWPFIEAQGKGRVVGVALGVFNPITGWWGEGDEKIWVDGEPFPSTFGTGSEDYFGYAWCNTALFQHAYHNQTLCEGPGNGNHTSVNRWHIIDNIPFLRSIKFTIEDWPINNKIGKDYCCTTYWYATPDTKDFFKPVPLAVRLPKPAWKPFRIKGLIEAENLKIAECTGGEAGPQSMGHFGGRWSGGKQLWWRATAKGQKLTLRFRSPKAGTFEVIAYLTKSWDYGIFKFAVNGTPAARDIDLFSGRPGKCVPTGPVSLGIFKLKKGNNTLVVEVAGKAEKSPGYFFGMDGLLLKAARKQ